MIKCISYWANKDGQAGTHPIDDALACTKKAGFAGMELCVGTDGVLTPGTSQAACTAIRKQIDAAGLVVETLASGMSWGFNPASDDAGIRKKAVALHADALQRAAWLGCKAMLFVPGVVKSPLSPDLIRYDVAVQRAREAVKQLLDTAEKVGVDLCVENVWNGLFYSPLEFRDFVDSFSSKRLGIYLDVGNLLGYQQHPPHWIELLGQRIRRVHVKDFQDAFGFLGAYSFCALGAGQVPWQAVMAALRGVGYNSTLVAEMMPWDPSLLVRTSAAMDVIMAM
ncbi:MAG TPA: sugar phosphate isomerase/epimerase family protein [Phycisphaerae bacterium]|nr:sugar phosphate isomerase/epimerase family protein [Phycisphaerae bacterium]HRY68141.1 sugar phosphate isomerase/epimerase family protein [Phycisphaerae bacterium]HSA27037.1 sugar phosphate isomerase/epimerase family protein [Phycisphaerae bacterium]